MIASFLLGGSIVFLPKPVELLADVTRSLPYISEGVSALLFMLLFSVHVFFVFWVFLNTGFTFPFTM